MINIKNQTNQHQSSPLELRKNSIAHRLFLCFLQVFFSLKPAVLYVLALLQWPEKPERAWAGRRWRGRLAAADVAVADAEVVAEADGLLLLVVMVARRGRGRRGGRRLGRRARQAHGQVEVEVEVEVGHRGASELPPLLLWRPPTAGTRGPGEARIARAAACTGLCSLCCCGGGAAQGTERRRCWPSWSARSPRRRCSRR